MNTAVLVIFVIVYLGMILGGLPFLQLDRTGVALLGVKAGEDARVARAGVATVLAAGEAK